MTLTVLSTGQEFNRISLSWDLADVFLMVRQQLWCLGRKTPEVKCHSHHIISYLIISHQGYIPQISTWHVAINVDLDHLAAIVFVRFLHYKVALSLPPSTLSSVERVGSYGSPFWGYRIYINYLEFFCICPLSLIYLSNHLFISMCELTDIYFTLWIIIPYYFIYLFAQIVPTLAIESSFSWPIRFFKRIQKFRLFY